MHSPSHNPRPDRLPPERLPLHPRLRPQYLQPGYKRAFRVVSLPPIVNHAMKRSSESGVESYDKYEIPWPHPSYMDIKAHQQLRQAEYYISKKKSKESLWNAYICHVTNRSEPRGSTHRFTSQAQVHCFAGIHIPLKDVS